MRPDIGKVDPFPRFSRMSRCLESNRGLLLLLLFFPSSLGLERPVGLGVAQDVLLKFLLAPQQLGSLILDVLQLPRTRFLHLSELLLVLLHEVCLRFLFFLGHHRVLIFSVRCLCLSLGRQERCV